MTEAPKESANKPEIMRQIAELSKMLGMIPSDDTVMVKDPVTQESMELSKWFDDTRKSLFTLSVLLDKTLDLNIQ